MSADGELTRQCNACYTRKPYSGFEFRSHADGKTGSYRKTCRQCRKDRLARKEAGTVMLRQFRNMRVCNSRVSPEVYVPGPKPCRLCCSLPWRITGLRCPECGLECATEPRPEMRLRRFDRVG